MERRPLAGGPVEADAVAVEEPLELRLRGRPLAVLLRTPGRERDLIAGFLVAEGLVEAREDLLAVEPCPDPETGRPSPHVWNVALAEGLAARPRAERLFPVSSGCGLCGARTVEALALEAPAPPRPRRLPGPDELGCAFAALRERQRLFAATAGCHGAGLWDLARPAGELRDVAEDVGRHNAVDVVLGARFLAGEHPLTRPHALLVSGRLSFELVQKAALGGVALLAGVGMPSSLAVRAARACGVTLVGWVRDGGGWVYAEPAD